MTTSDINELPAMTEAEIRESKTNETAKQFLFAERLFNSYNEQGPNPWKTWDGKDVPRWSALSDQVITKWMAVAEEARR